MTENALETGNRIKEKINALTKELDRAETAIMGCGLEGAYAHIYIGVSGSRYDVSVPVALDLAQMALEKYAERMKDNRAALEKEFSEL